MWTCTEAQRYIRVNIYVWFEIFYILELVILKKMWINYF